MSETHIHVDYSRIADHGRDPLELPTTSQLINMAMLRLADHPRAIFLGQGVAYGGVATGRELVDVPLEKRLEMPVAEELQLGMSIGLSLQGFLPISIFPRMDFLLRAMDQLVLHLDKLERMSCGQFAPKVIIRTRVGGKTPLDAGPQHTNDFTDAFRLLLPTVAIEKIMGIADVMPVYSRAVQNRGSTMVVECL